MVARVTYHSGRGSRGTKLQAQVSWGPPETQQPSSLSSHTHSVLRCPLVQLPSGLHRGPGPALHSPPRSRPGRWGAESSPQPCCHHLRGQTQDSGLLPGPLFSWAAGLSSSLQSMQLGSLSEKGPAQTRPSLEHSQSTPASGSPSPDLVMTGLGVGMLASQLTWQTRASSSGLWATVSAGSSSPASLVPRRPADTPVG